MERMFPKRPFSPQQYPYFTIGRLRPQCPKPNNLRSQPTQRKRLLPSEPEEDEDIPVRLQTKRRTNKPSINSDTDCSFSGLSTPPQIKDNIIGGTYVTPSPLSSPEAPPAEQTKTPPSEPDIDSEAEDEQEIINMKEKLAELEAKKIARQAKRIAIVMAADISETKNREDALAAALVEEVLKVHDGESEMGPEWNDGDDGGCDDGKLAIEKDTDDREADKTSVAEDDNSDDEESEKSDESDGDQFDGFAVDDSTDSGNSNEDSDDEYHEETDDEILDIENPFVNSLVG
ncbi:hypothetical protein V491_01812 [Pseudogymnoascus sp. VKM F-3775]|nr:hypothetical protein V491_01812 [Pseudogymnoascus sp. VKM F-3775]